MSVKIRAKAVSSFVAFCRALLLALLLAGLPALVGIGVSGLLTRFAQSGIVVRGIVLVASFVFVGFFVTARSSGTKEYAILLLCGTVSYLIGLGLTSLFGLSWAVVAYSILASQILPWSIIVFVLFRVRYQKSKASPGKTTASPGDHDSAISSRPAKQ